ncbi:hypothetical protein GCM10010270_14040 [Streptomyces violaceus]|nr:hypothetical protein GCM10010270_14040 [Streptomyces janthinus]
MGMRGDRYFNLAIPIAEQWRVTQSIKQSVNQLESSNINYHDAASAMLLRKEQDLGIPISDIKEKIH